MSNNPTIKSTIKEIFETMEYENEGRHIEENVNKVKEWFKKRNNLVIRAYGDDRPTIDPNPERDVAIVNPDSGETRGVIVRSDDYVRNKIENFLHEKTDWNNILSFDKISFFRKFAVQIKENEELICQLESMTRGLLAKDTKKFGVTLLIDCLNYFCQWTCSNSTASPDATIIYATDNTCLGLLGFALGPALTTGNRIVLHVNPSISVVAALLVELSVQAGIPDGVIMLMPSGGELWIPKKSSMMYLLDDVHADKILKSELYLNKQVVAFPNSKIPLIVFNNADLDSACECAVAAIWEYQGMLPWAVDTILVQEDIYPKFLKKLTDRMHTLHIGDSSDKLADISYPQSTEIHMLKAIEEARRQGIEVYQSHEVNTLPALYPTLFIGGKVYTNNVLTERNNLPPVPSILAFRSPREAAALANNNRQGFAVSVWTENMNLINEISRELNVGTIWANSHGIIKPFVPFTTYKLDGVGYIGGSLGFYEFKDQDKKRMIKNEEMYSKPLPDVAEIVQKSQNIQTVWNTIAIEARLQKLLKFVVELKLMKSKIPTINIDSTEKFYECFEKCNFIDSVRTFENFELITKREPVGVVVISMEEDSFVDLVTLGALLLGNTVILLTKNLQYYDFISKLLAPSIISVLDASKMSSVAKIAEGNPRMTFLGGNTQSNKFSKCYNNINDWDFILRRCSLFRNVWLSAGDSI